MWITSTQENKWTENNNYTSDTGSEIKLCEAVGKPLFGWGCCISELGVRAISRMGEERAEDVYKDLFGKEGLGFDFCRLSIGANDFAASWYSYNETEGDYEMKNFSIDRDRKYILPTVKTAMKYSPDLEFMASPWSPPTWMKTPPVYNFGRLIMTEENLKAYALYMRKYLEAYAEEGVKIKQLHVQNEVVADQKFPSCVFSGEQLTTFITDYLIDEIGDMTDIWFGTLNTPESKKDRHNHYLNLAMQNEKFKNNIKGASYQWAGKYGILSAEEDFPWLDTLNSECECGDGQNTWEFALYTYENIHHYLKHGARATVYWNMALDSNGVSTWGWRQNSLVSVDMEGNITYNPEYYLLKHFSHFVKRGARLLRTEGNYNTNTTAFVNPDGSKVAVIINGFDFEKVVTIEGKNYTLPPKSFNTIVL
ncbi:MAG: glycosyl hydrolase [Clostridia bacterium]|nr:glycosyl hydrolase [Clostridia bacterium]